MVKWYPFLNKSDKQNLYKYEKLEKENLIVCRELEYRSYAKFKDYLEFKNFREKINYKEDCFYEIIREESTRKPYFDIDIEKNKETQNIHLELIRDLKKSILFLVQDAIILIYTSHRINKFSYHIVVANYYFSTHLETKNFFEAIKNNIDIKYHLYLDESVYKTIQQFRILGSHKYLKDNKKILDTDLSINLVIPERYKKFPKGLVNFHLLNSLISNNTGCKYLDGYKLEPPIENFNIRGFSSTGDLEDVLNIFYSVFSADVFSYLNSQENNGNLLVAFRRLKESYCNECKRVHEHENPFVVVSGINRNIYYYCRRRKREEGGLYLGSLGAEKIPDLKIEDIPILEDNSNIEIGTSIVDLMKCLTKKEKSQKKPSILTDFLKI